MRLPHILLLALALLSAVQLGTASAATTTEAAAESRVADQATYTSEETGEVLQVTIFYPKMSLAFFPWEVLLTPGYRLVESVENEVWDIAREDGSFTGIRIEFKWSEQGSAMLCTTWPRDWKRA